MPSKSPQQIATTLANWIDSGQSLRQWVAQHPGVSRNTLAQAKKTVGDAPRSEWPALLKVEKPSKGRPINPIPAQIWQIFLSDYLRKKRPTLSSAYARTKAIAKAHGWKIPTEQTFRRRIAAEWTQLELKYAREGEHAGASLLPPQRRSVAHIVAGAWLNGDGYESRAYVRWADGTVSKAHIWSWQDIHSRKILSWCISPSESAASLRSSLQTAIKLVGIPTDVTIDNTRGAANKWLSGGIKHRYRFKYVEHEPEGIFKRLGIEPHWTMVIEGQGWGQGKPIERTHRLYADYLDKDPALDAHWKKSNPIPAAEFTAVVNRVLRAINAEQGRQTETAEGGSYNDAFARSFSQAIPIWPTEQQLHESFLIETKGLPDQHGVISLRVADGWTGIYRYQHPDLQTSNPQRLTVRFDPDELSAGIHVYNGDRHICTAARLWDQKYDSVRASKQAASFRKRAKTAAKRHVEAQALLTQAELAARLTPTEEEDPVVKPAAYRLHRSRRESA